MSEMELTEGQLLSQDFGVGGPPVSKSAVPIRPLAVIEAELDMLQRDTRQKEEALLCNYIEVGRRLEEAKAQLPHGQWGEWLKKKDYSQSTANNLMRLFREYGADQQSLFGGVAKSQSFANLTYSKALLMLTVPEEEREQFMAQHDVEGMSNRELKAAIKARDEAEEKAVAAEDEARRLRQEAERLQEQLTGQAQVYEAKLTSAGVEAARQAAIAEMTAKVDKAKELKKRADEARKIVEEDLAAAQKELAELKAKEPEARELTQEEKDALTAEAVNKVKAEGAEQIRNLKKKLAMANPNVAEFNIRFKSWQEEYWKMKEALDRIARDDEDLAATPRQLVKAALEQMA